MREWTHAEADGFCGGCGGPLTRGQPISVTAIVGVTRKFVRCEDCAGEAPPKLPAAVATAPEPARFAPLQEASPARTRGGLRRAVEWMPYRDGE